VIIFLPSGPNVPCGIVPVVSLLPSSVTGFCGAVEDGGGVSVGVARRVEK